MQRISFSTSGKDCTYFVKVLNSSRIIGKVAIQALVIFILQRGQEKFIESTL